MLKNTLRFLLAAIVLMPLASCGSKTNKALLGTWEGKNNNKTFSITFEKDGSLGVGGDIASLGNVFTSLTIMTDFGLHPGKNTPITYKCISDTQIDVEADFTALMEGLSRGGEGPPNKDAMKKLRPTETLTYAIADKELTLTNAKGKSTKLQKVE
jgi:hypothetical protein